jgi:protein gp37
VPESQSPLLLQAMGWCAKEKAGKELEGRTWDEMPANINLVKA